MDNDSLRVGARDVPLAEIEAVARETAAQHTPNPAEYPDRCPECHWRRWPCDPHDDAQTILALLAEVRRLRAVERCICGHGKAAHNDFDNGPCVWTIDGIYSCSCDAFALAAAPDTEGGTDGK